MKRFTETCKCDDPWFRNLKPSEKLLFLFLIDNCNNAGFYEWDLGAIQFKTGMTENQILGAVQGLNRGCLGADGWYWIRRFLRHQKNEDLNPSNNAHKQIISLLTEQAARFSKIPQFTEFVAPIKGLLSPIGTGKVKVQVKEEGSGETKPAKSKPSSQDEVTAFCRSILVPDSDAEYFWNKWKGNGFCNAGKAMRDWQATIRSWKAAGHLPSQSPRNGKQPTPQQTERQSRLDREYEEAQERLRQRKAARNGQTATQ